MAVDNVPFSTYGGGDSELHIFRPEVKEKPYSVVFLHGFGRDWEFYSTVGEEYSKRGVTVYMPDMRGHGTSQDRFDTDGMMRDAFALGEYIRREGKKAACVGHSMGANHALRMQACDDRDIFGVYVAVATPQSLSTYTFRYPAWDIVEIARRFPILERMVKTKIGSAIARKKDPRIQVDGNRIRYGRLNIDDVRDFASQIEGGVNLIEGYNNGFRVNKPTMMIFDENDPHNSYEDSIRIFSAMRKSLEDGTPLVLREVSGLDVGLSRDVMKTLADVSMPFLDSHMT